MTSSLPSVSVSRRLLPPPARGNVSVHGRGGDDREPERLLNVLQIGPVFAQARGEAVPEHVRGDVLAENGLDDPLENVPNPTPWLTGSGSILVPRRPTEDDAG